MKEFTVCYTLEDEIITEKVIKDLDVKKEEVEQEVSEKMDMYKSIIVKNEQGIYMIDSYLVRYVRIIDEKILV